MSDVKPKRAAREPQRSNIFPHQAEPTEAAGIAPEAIVPGEIVTEVPAAAEIVAVRPEAVVQFASESVSAIVDPLTDSADPWTGVAEAQAALARGFEAFALEMTGMTRSGIAAASDAAIALLAVGSVAELVDINAGLARHGVDWVIEGSARLCEIGVRAVGDASRPMLSRPMLALVAGAWSSIGAA
jgi:hypothetical protein